MHGPAEFAELNLDLFQRGGQRGAAVGTGGALREEALPLQLKFATPALPLGLFLVRCVVVLFFGDGGGCIRYDLGLLLCDGLAFPTLRHASIVRNRRPAS